MTLDEAVRTRRSVRRYTGKPLTDGQVRHLMEAAMATPSACDCRPWEFVVVRDREQLARIAACGKYTGMAAQAGAVIVICALPGRQEICRIFPAGLRRRGHEHLADGDGHGAGRRVVRRLPRRGHGGPRGAGGRRAAAAWCPSGSSAWASRPSTPSPGTGMSPRACMPTDGNARKAAAPLCKSPMNAGGPFAF